MATRTVANGGGNFNATGTWVEGAVPTAADAVVFTATSGQLTVNVASSCLSIDFTNYTNTITFNNTLTISGNVTLVAGFTQAGASGIIINANGTIRSNGVTWTKSFATSGTSVTLTLFDNWQINNSTCNLYATTTTLNGNTLNLTSLTLNNSTVTGTTNIVFNGSGTGVTGTYTGGGSAVITNNLTINTSGQLTITANLTYNTGTFTWTAGTVLMGSATTILNLTGSCILNLTSAVKWPYISINTSGTTTLNSDLYWTTSLTCTNAFTISGTGRITPSGSSASMTLINSAASTVYSNSQFASTLNILNFVYTATNTTGLTGLTLNINGNLTTNGGVALSNSGSQVNFVGTGTWSGTNQSQIQVPITINTLGTLTISGSVYFGGSVLTYTSGNVTTTGSTLISNVASVTTTFNTGSGTVPGTFINWNNISIVPQSLSTYVMSSNMTWSGLLQIGSLSTSAFSMSGSGKFVPSGSNANFTIIAATADYSYLFNSTVALKNLSLSDGTAGSSSQTLTFNGITFNLTGNLSWGFASITGTSTINMVGGIGSSVTCDGTSNSYPANGLKLNLTFNTAGTITLNTNFIYNTGTLTYTAGTVNATGANFYIGTSVTINTGSTVRFGNVYITSPLLTLATITLNSLLYVNGTITQQLSTSAVTPVFAGTAGFSTGTLTLASKGITFGSGLTYTIRTSFPYLGGLNQDSTYRFNTSTPGSPAYLTLNWGASCVVACLSFVDIDASGGRPIYVFTPVSISGSSVNVNILSNTKNIFKITDLLTVGS